MGALSLAGLSGEELGMASFCVIGLVFLFETGSLVLALSLGVAAALAGRPGSAPPQGAEETIEAGTGPGDRDESPS